LELIRAVSSERFRLVNHGVSLRNSDITRGTLGVVLIRLYHPLEGTVAEQAQTEQAQQYEGYCVKCKEKRQFQGNVEISKTGMRMAKGKCPTCGTTVNRILGKA
jgi:hypothetical protein